MTRKRPFQYHIIEIDGPVPPPPPRPGVRYVRVPLRRVIIIADDTLRDRIDRYFHMPMIVLGLLILPLLAIEHFMRLQPDSLLWWTWLAGMVIIWLAFLVEFIIKISIAECRIEYAKRNWLDIIIILMPALRVLRVATLAKTTRVFTLRGVGMKAARYIFTIVIGLEATERLMERLGVRKQGRADPRQMTRHQLITEISRLRNKVDAWERWHEAYEAHLDEHGPDGALTPLPPPPDDEEHDALTEQSLHSRPQPEHDDEDDNDRDRLVGVYG